MTSYLNHLQSIGNDQTVKRRIQYLSYNFRHEISILRSSSSILEIGPGNGELPSLLNKLGVAGIDIVDNDLSVLNYCKKNYRIRKAIYSKSTNAVICIKGHYDLIVLTQIFEHIPKKLYVPWIKKLHNSLNIGGSILITVPNGANPLIGAERYGDLQHENIFTVNSLSELVRFSEIDSAEFEVRGFKIPPTDPLNVIRKVVQKFLHIIFILMMIGNGGTYQTLLTPNITLVIRKIK